MDLSSLFWNIVVILDLLWENLMIRMKIRLERESKFPSAKMYRPIDCIYHTARFSQSGRETTPQNDFEIHVMHDIRFFLFVQAD